MVDSDQLDFLLSSSAGDTLHDQNKTFWVSRPLSGALCADLREQIGQRAGEPVRRISPCSKTSIFVTMAQDDRKDVLFSDITFSLCMNAGYFPKVYCKTDEFLVKVKLVNLISLWRCSQSPACRTPFPLRPASSIRCWKTRWQNEPSISCVIKKSLMTEAALDFWEFILDFYGLPQDDLD